MIVHCPKCGKETEFKGNPNRPFCSERCKILDLGDWAAGAYKIPVQEDQEDETSESDERRSEDET
jgi:uncharacterized protein